MMAGERDNTNIYDDCADVLFDDLPDLEDIKTQKVKVKLHRRIMLYGCKARSLILLDEAKFMVLENRTLKKMYRPIPDSENE